jgi:hypothetical protein
VNWEIPRILFLASGILRDSSPQFIPIRLQPQLKKYRCLWCMSTRNHYILYFLHLPSLDFPNKGKSLCKAQKALTGCGNGHRSK